MSGGNINAQLQPSFSTFDVNDAEIMLSSLGTLPIQDIFPSEAVPVSITLPPHPVNIVGANYPVGDVQMDEGVDRVVLRQACPSVEYQPQIGSATQSEQPSQRQSQGSSTSKKSGKGKDLTTLITVLQSKYPHPIILNSYRICRGKVI